MCGLVDQVPLDRTEPTPWCAHVGRVFWRDPDEQTQAGSHPWSRTVRVTVAMSVGPEAKSDDFTVTGDELDLCLGRAERAEAEVKKLRASAMTRYEVRQVEGYVDSLRNDLERLREDSRDADSASTQAAFWRARAIELGAAEDEWRAP